MLKIKKMRKVILCQDDDVCRIKRARKEIEMLKRRDVVARRSASE